jgi:hypothetical protein
LLRRTTLADAAPTVAPIAAIMGILTLQKRKS